MIFWPPPRTTSFEEVPCQILPAPSVAASGKPELKKAAGQERWRTMLGANSVAVSGVDVKLLHGAQ